MPINSGIRTYGGLERNKNTWVFENMFLGILNYKNKRKQHCHDLYYHKSENPSVSQFRFTGFCLEQEKCFYYPFLYMMPHCL